MEKALHYVKPVLEPLKTVAISLISKDSSVSVKPQEKTEQKRVEKELDVDTGEAQNTTEQVDPLTGITCPNFQQFVDQYSLIKMRKILV